MIREQRNGAMRAVQESYAVKATSLEEANSVVMLRLVQRGDDVQETVSSSKSGVKELMLDPSAEAGKFYKVRWCLLRLDVKNECMRRDGTTCTLVKAENVFAAMKAFEGGMKDTICDWEVLGVQEENVVEVYY